jgi:hypothetical protein
LNFDFLRGLKMISRRNFLKLAGLSTVAVGSGYLTGKLSQTTKPFSYSIHGFITEDEAIINSLLTEFKNKIRSNTEPVIVSDSKLGEVIYRFDLNKRNSSYSDKGEITYTLKKLGKSIDSDIIASDMNNSIYSLDDFNFTLSQIRNALSGRRANYVFTASYKESSFLASLLGKSKQEVVIENEKGVVERFSFEKNYKNVLVEGVQGKTGLGIDNGFVQVHTSSCRHEICKQTIAHNAGDIIACAPNKVLVRII